jgi:hypothetical protein
MKRYGKLRNSDNSARRIEQSAVDDSEMLYSLFDLVVSVVIHHTCHAYICHAMPRYAMS